MHLPSSFRSIFLSKKVMGRPPPPTCIKEYKMLRTTLARSLHVIVWATRCFLRMKVDAILDTGAISQSYEILRI